MNEVNKSYIAVFHGLGSAACEHDFFDLCGTVVELGTVLYALLDEVFLAVGQHFADHLPVDAYKVVLDEVERNVHVVLVKSGLECNLI